MKTQFRFCSQINPNNWVSGCDPSFFTFLKGQSNEMLISTKRSRGFLKKSMVQRKEGSQFKPIILVGMVKHAYSQSTCWILEREISHIFMAHHFILLQLNPFDRRVDMKGWWFQMVIFPGPGWLTPFRGWGSLTMWFISKFVYIYIYIYIYVGMWDNHLIIIDYTYSKNLLKDLFQVFFNLLFWSIYNIYLIIYIYFLLDPSQNSADFRVLV